MPAAGNGLRIPHVSTLRRTGCYGGQAPQPEAFDSAQDWPGAKYATGPPFVNSRKHTSRADKTGGLW
jgi:hypothetical protein